jgi:hypothetical protein
MEEGPFSLHTDVPPHDIDPESKGWFAQPYNPEWVPPPQHTGFPGRRIVAPRGERAGLLPQPITNESEIRALHGMLENMRRRVEQESTAARARIETLEQAWQASQSTNAMMRAQIASLRDEMERILRRVDPQAEAMVEAMNKRIDALKEQK